MKPYRRILRRLLTAVVVGLCLPMSVSAAALAAPGQAQPSPAKIGDTPADFAQPVATQPKAGDTPVDDPGASRAPKYSPPTIDVVRPERTIVRDVNQALPIILSGVAVLIALGGAGYAVLGTRAVRRGVVAPPQ